VDELRQRHGALVSRRWWSYLPANKRDSKGLALWRGVGQSPTPTHPKTHQRRRSPQSEPLEERKRQRSASGSGAQAAAERKRQRSASGSGAQAAAERKRQRSASSSGAQAAAERKRQRGASGSGVQVLADARSGAAPILLRATVRTGPCPVFGPFSHLSLTPARSRLTQARSDAVGRSAGTPETDVAQPTGCNRPSAKSTKTSDWLGERNEPL
jgi:hypothetical protein